jgi:hypothetical protein
MNLKSLVEKALSNANLIPLYTAIGGLSETYALVFTVSGIILAFRGHLDANFTALVVAVTGLLVIHDGLDDAHALKVQAANTVASPPPPEVPKT